MQGLHVKKNHHAINSFFLFIFISWRLITLQYCSAINSNSLIKSPFMGLQSDILSPYFFGRHFL